MKASANESAPTEHTPLLSGGVVPVFQVYQRRWYILLICSLVAFMYGGLDIVWSVIAKSVGTAFGWTDKDVLVMQNSIYVSYLVAMFPMAYLINEKGLRVSMILCCALLSLGTIMRSLSVTPPYITWWTYGGNVAIGLAGPVALNAGPVISAQWFPPHQRATATAIATIASMMGAAGSFLLGPLMVSIPRLTTEMIAELVDDFNKTSSHSNVNVIRAEIHLCRIIEGIICFLLFFLVLVYFPAKPPSSPSLTAAIGKLDFKEGLAAVFCRDNWNFWLVCLPYAMSSGIYSVWSSVISVILEDLIPENEIGRIGFSAILFGCLAGVLCGWLSDHFVGKMKLIVVLLNTGCMICTFWFILIFEGFIPICRTQLYVCCILQGLFNSAALPLYYEMAIENNYPVGEINTTSIMTMIFNIFPILFLVSFCSSSIGTRWMNWVLYFNILASIPILLLFKEQYRRLWVDEGQCPVNQNIHSSNEVQSKKSQQDVLITI